MKNLLNFISFEALNERILIPPDEDRRLKDEVLPKIKDILADKSRWMTWVEFNKHIKLMDYLKENPDATFPEAKKFIEEDHLKSKSISIRQQSGWKLSQEDFEEAKKSEPELKNTIPFNYKMSSGEEATVRFLVLRYIDSLAAFHPMERGNLKDNLILINAESQLGSQTVGSPEVERNLLSAIKHELIHAKDPGANQYKYSNFDHPRKREEYREKYFKTKPEGIAFGGQFLEEIRDRTREFVRGGLTEEKVKTLNSVLNDLANGFMDPSDLSPETIEFLGYSNEINYGQDFQPPRWAPPNWTEKNTINRLKSLRAQGNLEFRKFQRKFYQEIIRIAAEINSDLSAKYPQIKGRIKISSSQP